MPLREKQILVIDDTPSIRTFLRISLEGHGAQFHEASNAIDGVRLRNDVHPDIVVLDLGLPDVDGLEILPGIKQPDKEGHSPKVVILSVRKEQSIKDKATELGADAYVTKPFLMEDLIETLHSVVAR